MNHELETLLQRICHILNESISDVKSRARFTELVDARTIYVWIAKQQQSNIEEIMRVINRHRTLFYATQERYLDFLQYDSGFLAKVNLVERELRIAQKKTA